MQRYRSRFARKHPQTVAARVACDVHQHVNAIGPDTLRQRIVGHAGGDDPLVTVALVALRCRVGHCQLFGVRYHFHALVVMLGQQWLEEVPRRMVAEGRTDVANAQATRSRAAIAMGTPLGLQREANLRIERAVRREYLFRCVVRMVVQHKQQIAVCVPVGRVERQGTPDTGLGLLHLPLVLLQVAKSVVRLHEVRLELHGTPDANLSFFNPTEFIQHHTEVEVRYVKCLVKGNTAAQAFLRLLQAAAPVQHHAKIAVRQWILRRQCNRLAKTELGLYQTGLVHQCQAERTQVAAVFGAQKRQPAQRLHRLPLLRLLGQCQHLPGQRIVRAGSGQVSRRQLQLRIALLIQQAGEGHNIRARGFGGAGVRCLRCNRPDSKRRLDQPFKHLVDCVGCEPGAPRVLQHLRCLPELAAAYQSIQVTDPVLPVPGHLVASGSKIPDANGCVIALQRNDAQVMVCIRMSRLLLQHRLIGGLRLGEPPVPVQLGALLH